MPLLEQAVANARALGIAASLTGPAIRGDAGHDRRAPRGAAGAGRPAALPVYRALLERDAAIARERGALSPESAETAADRTCSASVTR